MLNGQTLLWLQNSRYLVLLDFVSLFVVWMKMLQIYYGCHLRIRRPCSGGSVSAIFFFFFSPNYEQKVNVKGEMKMLRQSMPPFKNSTTKEFNATAGGANNRPCV